MRHSKLKQIRLSLSVKTNFRIFKEHTRIPRPACHEACGACMTHDTPCATVGAGGASRDRTGDLLVANQTLSQLSYGPFRLIRSAPQDPGLDMVGLGGVEPPTSPLSGVRSNQLSYRPGGQRRVAHMGPTSEQDQLTH